MRNNGRKNTGFVAVIIIMTGIIVMLLVILLLFELPTLDTFMKESTIETSETNFETEEETTEIEIIKPTYQIENFVGYKEAASIQYPVISGMEDTTLQSRINEKIKTNAISIVSLYPVSTALQKVNIIADVTSFSDDFISIIYTGEIIGNNVKDKTSGVNLKSDSSGNVNSSNSSSYDPYLNGFIDPLTGKYIQPTTPVPQNNINSLPLPNGNGTAVSSTTNNNNVISNKVADMNKNTSGAVDGGPTAESILRPTSAAEAQNKGLVSNGTVYQAAPTTNTDTTNQSSNVSDQIPVYITPANGNSNLPVYGYSGTNTSESTIYHKIFYTNTIDLKNCRDVALPTLADAETLAKYARSTDVEFVNISEENRTEVRNYIRKTSQTKLTETINDSSDFRNTILKTWPKHFSYVDSEGAVCFSIKLSSRLGNYAIVRYKK